MGQRNNRNDRPAVLHYLTLNVREKKRAFSQEAYAETVLRLLRLHCDLHPAKLIAYVAMPTHLHCIINPRMGDVTKFLQEYKAACTSAIHAMAAQAKRQTIVRWLHETPGHHPQLWQDGKHDFYLYSQRIIWQKIDYIHNNPIRAGLVTHATEYPLSSFRAYYPCDKPAIVQIDTEFWWDDLPMDFE